MARKPSDIERLLQSKFAFKVARAHSSDHHWYELQLPGLPVILTKVSHTKKDIGPKIEGMIARQLRVRKPFFDGMMDCTKSREAYYDTVKKAPFPPFDVRF